MVLDCILRVVEFDSNDIVQKVPCQNGVCRVHDGAVIGFYIETRNTTSPTAVYIFINEVLFTQVLLPKGRRHQYYIKQPRGVNKKVQVCSAKRLNADRLLLAHKRMEGVKSCSTDMRVRATFVPCTVSRSRGLVTKNPTSHEDCLWAYDQYDKIDSNDATNQEYGSREKRAIEKPKLVLKDTWGESQPNDNGSTNGEKNNLVSVFARPHLESRVDKSFLLRLMEE